MNYPKKISIPALIGLLVIIFGVDYVTGDDEIGPNPSLIVDYDLMELRPIEVGDDVYLKCFFDQTNRFYPQASYTFLFNDSLLLPYRLPPTITIFRNSLYLRKINETQAGVYGCQVKRSPYDFNLLRSSNYVLKVHKKNSDNRTLQDPKQAFIVPDNEKMMPGCIVVGKRVLLKCIVQNENHDAVYTFQYRINQTHIIDFGEEYDKDGIFVNRTNTLEIRNVTKQNAGQFRCRYWSEARGINLDSEYYPMAVHNNSKPSVPDYHCLPDISVRVQGFKQTNIVKVPRFMNTTISCSIAPKSRYIKKVTWRHFDEVIKTTDMLEVSKIKVMDAGPYSCEVMTRFGNIIGYLNLQVANVPMRDPAVTTFIRNGLKANEIYEFDDVYINCHVAPSVMFTSNRIFWRNKDGPLHQNFAKGIIYIDEGRTLLLKSISKKKEGSYSCVVDADIGFLRSSEDVVINVRDNLTAARQVFKNIKKADVYSVCESRMNWLKLPRTPIAIMEVPARFNYEDIQNYNHVYFTCFVTPITSRIEQIRWYIHNDEIFSNKQIKVIGYPPTLLILNPQKPGGVIRISCEAVLDGGDIKLRSDNKMLSDEERLKTADRDTPIVLPELLHNPDFIYVNQSVWLYCHVHFNKTPENVTIVWFKENTQLLPVDNNTAPAEIPSNYATYHGRTMKLHNVNKDDIGNYTCQIDKGSGLLENKMAKRAQITKIKDPSKIPSWTIPAGVEVIAKLLGHPIKYEEEYVYFYCTIRPKSLQPQRVRWLLNDELLDQTIDDGVKTNGSSLKLADVKKSQSGNVVCQIDTAMGTFTSEPTPLQILEKPNFEVYYAHTAKFFTHEAYAIAKIGHYWEADNIMEGDSFYLYCDINPHRTMVFSIIWKLENTPVKMPFSPEMARQRILTIKNISKFASGRYRCEANTRHGFLEGFIDIKVKPKRT